MAVRFDTVILGMGPGGEVVAGKLLGAGKRVAVIEKELIGGECGYWACIPSKTLIRPPEARSEARRAFGTSTPTLNLDEIFDYRDFMIRNLDDSKQIEGYEEKGATVLKGEGRIVGPGTVEVTGQKIEAGHIVIATGSAPTLPPIEGLDKVKVWTNREVTTTREIPARTLVIGGGPNGIETAQWMSRLGSNVILAENSDRLLQREGVRIGGLVKELLEEDGVEICLGAQIGGVSQRDSGISVALEEDGFEVDVIVVATGRAPRTENIGLENLGTKAPKSGIPVDERCQVEGAENVWAVGDVTGIMPFTHVAQYQGRVVASNILGKERRAHYKGIPRVVFSDPEVAAAGLTEEMARESGMDVATAAAILPETLARPWTYERDPRGEMGLVADRDRGVLVGAWAVAPLAGEWIHTASLAIKAEIPIEELLDNTAQFPTYSGAYIEVLEALEL